MRTARRHGGLGVRVWRAAMAATLIGVAVVAEIGASSTASAATTFTNYKTGLGYRNVNGVFAVGSTIYAATGGGLGDSTGGGLSISTDGGATFTNKTVANGLGSNNVHAVFAVGSTVYAGTQAGLSISTDGGATFTNEQFLDNTNQQSITYSPRVYSVYVDGSKIYAATGWGMQISTDGGATFTNYTTSAGLGYSSVYDVYVVGSTVYAATGGGVSISTDGGVTYTNYTTSSGLGGNVVRGIYVDGTTVYAATNSGLSISTNGGVTYTNKAFGSGLGNTDVTDVYAVGSTVYATTSAGFGISTNGGNYFRNYTKDYDGLGANNISGLFVNASNVYAATADGVSIAPLESFATTTTVATTTAPTTTKAPTATVAPTTTVASTTTIGASSSVVPSSATLAALPKGSFLGSTAVTAGGKVTVQSAGFIAEESVAVFLSGTASALNSFSANDKGQVSGTVIIPPTVQGKKTMYLYGTTSKKGKKQTLNIGAGSISAPATAVLSALPEGSFLARTSVSASGKVAVSGSGFVAGEQVGVYLSGSSKSFAILLADANGNVSGSVTIPSSATGAKSVYLYGVTSAKGQQQAVSVAANSSKLPATGSDMTTTVGGLLLVLAGVALLGRRRRYN